MQSNLLFYMPEIGKNSKTIKRNLDTLYLQIAFGQNRYDHQNYP